MSEEKKVTVSGLLADLDSGLNRKDIGKKYGLSMKAVKQIFSTPALLNKKSKPSNKVNFTLIDDVTVPGTETVVIAPSDSNEEITTAPVANETVTPTVEPEVAETTEEPAAQTVSSPFDRS